MEAVKEKNNIIGSKLRITFAVFVIFVLMAAVAVVFLGIGFPQQQQIPEKQQQGSHIESSFLPTTSKLTGLVDELENTGSTFLEKTKTTNEFQTEKNDWASNHFFELNCDELLDIVSSFEGGWDRVLAEFSVICEMYNVDSFCMADFLK